MQLAQVGLLVALTLTCGCVRLGYDARNAPHDTAPRDSGEGEGDGTRDGGSSDAAVGGKGGKGGKGGSGGKVAAGSGGGAGRSTAGIGGAGGSSANAGDGGISDAGHVVDVDMKLGDTGLKVADILGFYSGTWGDMVLRKIDNEIWGAYAYRDGTIVGNITSEGVFEGWWSQTPSRDASDTNAGEVEFRWMTTDGGTVIHLDGRWRYGASGTWNDYWDVDLVTDRTAPASITDHFDVAEDFKRHP